MKQIRLYHKLVQDDKYSDMWRVLYPNGDLSDLLNYDRAKELKIEQDHERKPNGGYRIGKLGQPPTKSGKPKKKRRPSG